jgi:hypothetical protein
LAIDIATTEPAVIIAGTTVQWTKTLSDYPASEWTLKYAIRGIQAINITAEADGDDYAVTINAADTEIWQAGNYWWYSFVEKGSGPTFERYQVAEGRLAIKTDPEALEPDYDGRSHAKIMLDAIEATLQGKATYSQLDLLTKSLGDKNIQRNPELLMKWRTYYRAEYQNELNKDAASLGTATDGKVRVRFRSAR